MRAGIGTTLLVLALASGCKGDKSKDEPPAPGGGGQHPHAQPVDIRDPAACERCHPTIVAEWTTSMHARAHHSRDPIYAGVRAIRAEKEGDAILKACAGCHTPGFEADPNAAAAAVGVGCATCHNERVDAAPGQLLGPNDVSDGATTAHGTGPAHAALTDGTSVCMTCHASLDSPSGLSMCATGAEHATLAGDDQKSCASCHMPQVDGPATMHAPATEHASHAFLGPHMAWYQNDASFAASAVEVTATLSGRTLAIAVVNKSGHSFPTGFPGRMAIVSCVGRDGDGTEVWKCEPRPLGKKYVDDSGAPTLAPYAAKLASDTRIAPGATLAFEVETPAAVTDVDVMVSLRLVPPPLADKLGLTDAPEGQPVQLVKVAAQQAVQQ